MSDRAHDLDAARAILLFVGVPYHTFKLYDVDRSWVIASDATSATLGYLARVIHGFRLPAFFVIAGYFSLMLVRRRGSREWLRARAIRLGVPLLTAVVAIVPVQEVFRHRAGLAQEDAWNEAVRRTLHGLAVPGEHLVAHLWFLIDLLVLSAGFAAAWAAVGSGRIARGTAWLSRCREARPVATAVAALAGLGLYELGVFGSLAVLGDHRLVYFAELLNLHRILGYAPFFALGALLAERPDLFAAFTRCSRATTAGALASALALALLPRSGLEALGTAALLVASPVVAALMTRVVLSATHRFLNRSNRVIRLLVDSSFTVYLVHQPIIVGLGYLFLGVELSPVVEAAVIAAAAACASVAAHRLIAPRPALLFLFNGVRPKVPRPRALENAA